MTPLTHPPNPDELISVIHCDTVTEFLAALSPRSAAYASAFPRAWIFRGHSNDEYALVPTALRNNSKDLRDLTLQSITNNKEQLWAEHRVLADFLQVSDSIGLHIPEDTQRLRLLFDVKSRKPELWPQDDVLSMMALAQHHGIPTRLLDWSRNPYKAALFAAFGAYESQDKNGRLSVWALSIEKLEILEQFEKPFIVITAPSATNLNLRAQEGIFTLAKHITADEFPVDRTSFEKILGDWVQTHKVKSPGAWFHRVTLPQHLAAQLCFELSLEGFTRATLFPDFYGVAKAIKDTASLYDGSDTPGGKRATNHFDSFYLRMEHKVSIKITPSPK